MTCHITGSVVIPDGSSAANRKITFRKEAFTVTTDGGLTVVPEYITVYTDSSGNVSFDLMPGAYSGFYVSAPDGRLPFRFNVPSDAATANFADLIVTSSVTEDQGLIDLVNRAYEVIQDGYVTPAWGSLTGVLADQTDLQTELDSKVGRTNTQTITGKKHFTQPITFVGVTSDPSSHSEGEVWYNTNENHLKANVGGSLVELDTPLWSRVASKPTTLEGYGITNAAKTFNTRSDFVTWTSGSTSTVGSVVTAGGYAYRHIGTGAAIADLPGWIPEGDATPMHFGAVGDGVADDLAAFVAMDAYGKSAYIPKPINGYNFSTPLTLTVPVIADPGVTWAALTDSGQLSWFGGRDTNTASPDVGVANIHRLSDRVFMGRDAANGFAGDRIAGGADSGTAWFSSPANGASYLPRDASVIISTRGMTGAAFIARTSDDDIGNRATIGFGSMIMNDGEAAGGPAGAWGGILEMDHRRNGGLTLGLEIGAKDSSTASRIPATPYASTGGVYGIWGAGGGDASFGPAATTPADSLIMCVKNGTSGLPGGGWQSALTVSATAIQGTDGSMGSGTTGEAIKLARMHQIAWYEPTTNTRAFSLHSQVTNAAGAWKLVAGNGALTLRRANEVVFAQLRDDGASGVDYPVLQNGTGIMSLRAEGASANIDAVLVAKGAGNVKFVVGGSYRYNFDAANFDVIGNSTEAVTARLGYGRSGDGLTTISLVGDASNVEGGMLINRYGGANGVSEVRHKGAGNLQIVAENSAAVLIKTAETTALTIGSDQSVKANGTGGLGYGSGAGGTVTQATSKTSGVTLNRPAGQITTTADALAAGASASFILTNSCIGSADTVVVTHRSSSGSYSVRAGVSSSGGSALVTLKNETAGSLSDAVVINFTIIKGVLS